MGIVDPQIFSVDTLTALTGRAVPDKPESAFKFIRDLLRRERAVVDHALLQSASGRFRTWQCMPRKIDTVKARFLYCGLLEIASLLCGAIAAVVRYLGHFPENSSGIGLTVAYFGLQLIIFAIFNFPLVCI